MKLLKFECSKIKEYLQYGGTRLSIVDEALRQIGCRSVYIGATRKVCIAKIGSTERADYGWSKCCSYFPKADKWNFKLGAKLAILRALGIIK